MNMPYKVEFFDRNFQFCGFSAVPKPDIVFDYIMLSKTVIVVPNVIDVMRGWYVHVTQGAEIKYQGIISDVVVKNDVTEISCKPLISLLDVMTYYHRHLLANETTENGIKLLIESAYRTMDIDQNLTGMVINALTSTDWSKWNLKDNIHDLYDLIILKALECAGVVVNCTLLPHKQEIEFDIVNTSVLGTVVIEADLPNILSKNFTFADSYGATNKVTIVNRDDESEQYVAYAQNYEKPIFWHMEYLSITEDEEFEEKAAERAVELLSQKKGDNLIELEVRANDKLIPEIAIGQNCTIIHNGRAYETVFTGIENNGEIQNLLFGLIRADFTHILEMERRG